MSARSDLQALLDSGRVTSAAFADTVAAANWLAAHGERVAALIDAARRYREIALADPTSLDRPTAGKDLDLAVAALDEEQAAP